MSEFPTPQDGISLGISESLLFLNHLTIFMFFFFAWITIFVGFFLLGILKESQRDSRILYTEFLKLQASRFRLTPRFSPREPGEVQNVMASVFFFCTTLRLKVISTKKKTLPILFGVKKTHAENSRVQSTSPVHQSSYFYAL